MPAGMDGLGGPFHYLLQGVHVGPDPDQGLALSDIGGEAGERSKSGDAHACSAQ
ncbi:hypothetical protein D9M71_761690 [compost metagenome]